MPTPAKNLTGPSGLTTNGPRTPKADNAVPPAILAQLAGVPAPVDRRITGVCAVVPKVKAPHVPHMPDPQFGRQIVMTFPAIYKERPRGDNAVTGQIYPPKAP